MRAILPVVVFWFVLCSLAGAQVYSDSFDYPDGTTVPGWNESVGDWTIKNKELVCEHKFLWQYIVLDSFSETNACVQMTVIAIPDTTYYQDGGGTLRYSTLTNVMCKIQDNNRNGDLDMCYVYDRPGSANSSAVNPATKRATVRFFTLDTDLVCQVDINQDGSWDVIVNRTTAQNVVAGKPGIHGLGGPHFDDFKYFNAVARIDPASATPSPGNRVTVQLKGPANKLYQCAASFGNRGFPLDAGRAVPLDLDNLFFLSVQNPVMFQSFNGRLDGNGDGKASVQIPNVPALSGQTLYVGMVVFDAAAPSLIGHISNDVRVDLM
jgi:hypothetical protein